MSIIEKVLDKLEKDETVDTTSKKIANKKDTVELQQVVTSAGKAESVNSDQGYVVKTKTENIVDLDFDKLNKIGILTPVTVNITLSEQLRRIKMPILANAFGGSRLEINNRNMVMVTSSVQNEGKSFTSLNLAMSIAKEFNHTVLYIDADVTQRSMDKLLNLGVRPGLVDILLDGECELKDLLLKTNVPRLTLLPSGRPYDKVTELWSSHRMGELMNELSQRYNDRLIVFDTPPLLQDSSASMLASLVGQILIVVEAEKTPRHVVEEAVSLLGGSQYNGLILNKSNQRESVDYGYYYNST
jgi:protein-tyrosine kinase